MNELFFLGMDIVEETKTLVGFTTIACTDNMTDGEISAYKLGVTNTIATLKAVLENNDAAVVNIEGMDIPTELSVDEVMECYEVLY